jgi:hypothetical protein
MIKEARGFTEEPYRAKIEYRILNIEGECNFMI